MVDACELQRARLESVGAAAAGIAHDMNNQLTLILNHLETPDIEAARAAADRCSALTASLLSWCRGEPLRLSGIEPVAWLAEFAGSLTLPESVALELELPGSLPSVKAEPVALARILTNLVRNALDAMGGSGVLRIRAAKGLIQVEDSGPGIPLADRERVFEPFFSTKGNLGTGLGLAIVRDLMRQQGGSITLCSPPGHGACFQLRFRLQDER
ncbi:MAG: HAMP domain-containing sensor histidine kinase [Acidobacteriota bacterium]